MFNTLKISLFSTKKAPQFLSRFTDHLSGPAHSQEIFAIPFIDTYKRRRTSAMTAFSELPGYTDGAEVSRVMPPIPALP
jgi:hypothetical protein